MQIRLCLPYSKAVHSINLFILTVLNLKLFTLHRCGLGGDKDHRHRRDDNDRDRQLNVLSEARSVWFALAEVKCPLVNSAVVRIERDTFRFESEP
ncbi:hypothetical protein EVAR_34546_1 [Eumeta japonica]|uniref:Uncharacterized protein n=1 Tax=Eumeta variegata TaxID=151549 RepID=A0A4C1X876_EUMVA|nr:hypothetical protein EVAR_34546_1 [Eumeta japonica]